MKIKVILSLVLLTCVAAFAADTNAVLKIDKPAPAEQWVLSLGGSGSTTTTGNSESLFGADISIGRTGHLLLPLEGGLRQGFYYNSAADDNETLFSTKGYLDVTVLTYKKLDLFAGGSVGLTYGNTKPIWTAGPEAGLRFWIKKDVSILGRVEYPFDLDNSRAEDVLKYFLGLQVKF